MAGEGGPVVGGGEGRGRCLGEVVELTDELVLLGLLEVGDDGVDRVFQVLAGEGAQILLGLLQGGGPIAACLAIAIVVDTEESGGGDIDAPEGTDDAAGTGTEETGAEGEQVVGDCGVAEGGFATGEEDFEQVGHPPTGTHQLAEGEGAIPQG